MINREELKTDIEVDAAELLLESYLAEIEVWKSLHYSVDATPAKLCCIARNIELSWQLVMAFVLLRERAPHSKHLLLAVALSS